MTAEQILAAVAALIAGQANPDFDRLRSGGFDDRYPVTVGSCDYQPAAFEVEGQTILCGTVSVPEDYDKPDGRRVALKFAVLDALTQSPAPDPLVYLHGGPASGTLKIIDAIASRAFYKHRQTRDIITFDQRASTLSAGSVACSGGLADHVLDIALAKRDNPDGGEGYMAELVAPCVAEINASGADLSAYNTANNARDVRALMSALGHPVYNIYGISYGTRLSLEVMRTAPEGVRSVVIDGVAPAFVKIIETFNTPFADGMDKLAEQCAVQPACAAAYPDVGGLFNAAIERLGNEPISGGPGGQVLDPGVLYTVTFDMRNNWRDIKVITPYLPRIFAEAAQGKREAFDAMLARFDRSDDPKAALGGADLTDDERALALAALDIAGSMKTLGNAADAAVRQLRSDLRAAAQTVSIAEAFDRRGSEALSQMTDRAAAAAFMRNYALLRAGEPTKAALQAFVQDNFDGHDRDDLLALVTAMGPADVARTFRIAAQATQPYEVAVALALGLDIYICQESRNSVEGYDRETGEIAKRYPIFAMEAIREKMKAQLAQCDAFQEHPREGYMEPVVSDIPTLVLNGTLDVQTSMNWGALAAQTLSNSRNYIIPEAGHGTIIYQPCAQDIATTFVNDPGAELDVSCIDTLEPVFLLPDDPLP